MNRKMLLKKLRKCMALSRSANEHEAAAALNVARRLMAEHGITEDDVALAEIAEATARGSRTRRPAQWESFLCAAVRRSFGVSAFVDEAGDWCFVGRGAAPEVARYAWTVLFRQLRAARAAYIATRLKRCTTARKRVRADLYCQGWALAVHQAISALVPKPEPDELVARYLAEHYPNLAPIQPRSRQARGRVAHADLINGYAAGDAVELRGGLNPNPKPLELPRA